MPVLWQVLLPLPPPGIVKTKKRNIQKQHPQHPQQRFSRASLCTPAAASLAVRNLMNKNKPSSPKLQHSWRSLYTARTSGVHLHVPRCHRCCPPSDWNSSDPLMDFPQVLTPQSPHAELGDLEIEAFCEHWSFLFKERLSYQRTMRKTCITKCCTKMIPVAELRQHLSRSIRVIPAHLSVHYVNSCENIWIHEFYQQVACKTMLGSLKID